MKLGSELNGRHADRSISINCSCHHDESFKVIYFVNVRITCIYETNRGEYISLLNNRPVDKSSVLRQPFLAPNSA